MSQPRKSRLSETSSRSCRQSADARGRSRHVSVCLNAALPVRGLLCGPLLALGFATLPAVATASCVSGATGISNIYGDLFPLRRSHGTRRTSPGRSSSPWSLSRFARPLRLAKRCGQGQQSSLLTGHLGELQPCCGASDSSTGDSPQLIFNRLVAVLVKDHFYDLANSSQPARSDAAAFYSIAVVRCDAQPHDKSGGSMFVAPPQAKSTMSIVALSIPFGSMPEVTYGSIRSLRCSMISLAKSTNPSGPCKIYGSGEDRGASKPQRVKRSALSCDASAS